MNEEKAMPANVFNVFMSEHPPIGKLVDEANTVLWDQSALDPVVKERMRIALAESIGCSYCARFRTQTRSSWCASIPRRSVPTARRQVRLHRWRTCGRGRTRPTSSPL